MKIWLLQTGEPLHIDAGDNRPMRAMNLADTLVARGHDVTMWSADFDHINKRFRKRSNGPIEIRPNLKIKLVPSTGYQRNVGFGRLLDHFTLGFHLSRRLRNESGLPDVAFVGYPPIEAAYVMLRRMRNRGVPVLLDVKDQWPVIFTNSLPKPLRPLGGLLFFPYNLLAKKTLRSATGISAMADGFLNWALEYAGREPGEYDRAYPLTTRTGAIGDAELRQAGAWWKRQGLADDDIPKVCFIGSFSSAFDFTPVAEAARLASDKGDHLQFVLCGDGGNVERVKAMMAGRNNVLFPGWIDRPRIEALAARCVAAIAPYRSSSDFMLSIPNKIVDALALGLPILSPLEGEVADLIDTHEVGVRYVESPDTQGPDLYHAIKKLIDDSGMRQKISGNARSLYDSRFSFDQVYGDLASQLEQMAAAAPGRQSDKNIEHDRYEQRARTALADNHAFGEGDSLAQLPAALRAPYLAYTAEIEFSIADSGMKLLEIGAGTGMYTWSLVQTGARVVATDISASSLEILSRRLSDYSNLETRVADMESLPFADGEFDVVCSAGSLSYGDNDIVINEIYRVLKPGGRFICVDSLNHNPVYRFNRWIQYLRGRRTRSTIERMPTMELARRYGRKFGQVSVRYFGSITWCLPLLKFFLSDETAARFSAKIDRLVGVAASAFKLVMVAEKKS